MPTYTNDNGTTKSSWAIAASAAATALIALGTLAADRTYTLQDIGSDASFSFREDFGTNYNKLNQSGTPQFSTLTLTSQLQTPSIISSGALGVAPASGSNLNVTITGSGALLNITSANADGIHISRASTSDDGIQFIYDTNGTNKWVTGFLGDATDNYRHYNVAAGADAFNINSSTNVMNITSLTLSNALPVASGGTGQTSYTDGQLLIGNTTGNTLTKATLTQTSNQVLVTNGHGTITLSTPQDIATGSAVQFGSLKLGTSSFAATSTFESRATSGAQFIASYDASNYLSITTASTGSATYHVIAGSGTPSHIFPDPVFYSKVFTGFSNGDSLLSISSTTNSMTSSNTNTLYAQNLDIRLNQAGFTNSAGVGLAATRQVAYINGASGTVNTINGTLLQVGNLGAGTLNTATTISIQGGLNSGGGTLGAWYGIDIADSSAGGTNNIALRSRVTSGTGKYNAYLDGTAQNYIGGSVGIGNSGTLLGKLESRATSGAQIVAAYDGSNYYTITIGSTGSATLALTGTSPTFTFSQDITSSGNLTIADAKNIVLNTTTGTKIGTATGQKLGFWNATPVIQYATTGTTTGFTASTGTTVVSGSTFTGNTGSTAYTIGDVVRCLKTCGLMAA